MRKRLLDMVGVVKDRLIGIYRSVISLFKKNINKFNKKKDDNRKKINYKCLTIEQIEKELKRTKYNEKYLKILRSTIYSLIIIASIATIIATLLMPVLQISGSSMADAFNEGDIVVSVKTKNLKFGDVIAFYHGNKVLVKRVIANSGSFVIIDEFGNVYVDGEKLVEPYVNNSEISEYDIEFPYQVPDGEYFVLSDQRSDNVDSKNSEIGCVSQDDIIGKILFRIWPLKK